MIKEGKDILSPYGDLDLLYYYSLVARKLGNFLKGKELATKIHLSGKMPKLLKRGSQLQPIYIPDLLKVDEDLLKLRVGHHLKEVREKLTYPQIVLWEYFFPRRMIDLFYACNREHPGKPLERIFIDIDKGQYVSSETAQEVCRVLLETILWDKKFNTLAHFKPRILWTGNSFHLYLLLNTSLKPSFYDNYLSYRDPQINTKNFISIWAAEVSKQTGIHTEAGHEKSQEHIILDSSGTPSGKLARAPFSLHIPPSGTYDGIALPLSQKDLSKKTLVKRFRKLTPEDVVNNLDKFAKLL